MLQQLEDGSIYRSDNLEKDDLEHNGRNSLFGGSYVDSQ
jgi:hypothetical protein